MPAGSKRTKKETRPTSRRAKRESQAALPFPSRGGWPKGKRRKPAGEAGVPHVVRERLTGREPVHVTLKLLPGLPRLRDRRTDAALRAAFAAGCDRSGFRMAHYSVQNDHLHMICEAPERASFARGVQGLTIRVARALNKLWGRKGKVFADRYHDHVLRSPREVRNALRYVLQNAAKHGRQFADGLDRFASGAWFDGWRESFNVKNLPEVTPVARARTWLLTKGWRKHGLLSLLEAPKGAPG